MDVRHYSTQEIFSFFATSHVSFAASINIALYLAELDTKQYFSSSTSLKICTNSVEILRGSSFGQRHITDASAETNVQRVYSEQL